MKYRAKPVVIEAILFTKELALDCLLNKKAGPFGLCISGEWNGVTKKLNDAYIGIDTLEGTMRANLGDYIVKGIKGEFYPVKSDIFEEKYEVVNDID